MVDFHLVQGGRQIKCQFIGDTLDLTLGLKNWRGKTNHGDVVANGDIISIVPLATDRARLSIRGISGHARKTAVVYSQRPDLQGSPSAMHYLSGEDGVYRYCIFKLATSNPQVLLVQRFIIDGGFQNHEPDRAGVIRYPGDPSLVSNSNWLNLLGADGTRVIVQDDEGSGEEPLP